MKCKSIIEIEKELRKEKHEKKRDILSRLVTPNGTKGCASHVGAGCTFCPGWCYQPGQKVLFCPGCQTRTKGHPLLSRTGVPGGEIRTTGGFPTGTNQRFCSSEKCLTNIINLLVRLSISWIYEISVLLDADGSP